MQARVPLSSPLVQLWCHFSWLRTVSLGGKPLTPQRGPQQPTMVLAWHMGCFRSHPGTTGLPQLTFRVAIGGIRDAVGTATLVAACAGVSCGKGVCRAAWSTEDSEQQHRPAAACPTPGETPARPLRCCPDNKGGPICCPLCSSDCPAICPPHPPTRCARPRVLCDGSIRQRRRNAPGPLGQCSTPLLASDMLCTHTGLTVSQ